MYISQIDLDNIRCFNGHHVLNTSKNVNLLIGNNNSGKSTILKSIHHLQGYQFLGSDRTIDTSHSSISIKFKTKDYYNFLGYPHNPYNVDTVHSASVRFRLYSDTSSTENFYSSIDMFLKDEENEFRKLSVNFTPYENNKKRNLLYLYFSNRKPAKYNNSVLLAEAEKINTDLSNLFAKIDSIVSRDTQILSMYRKACIDILGYFIGTVQDGEGKHAAFAVDNERSIPITSMGDGVPNILGLITDLCLAENKIFLIEEIENDIHPKALKSLLNLIEFKSTSNQFFISTHSNIVLRHLGADENNKIFHIISKNDFSETIKIPSSIVEDVPNDPQMRMDVLESLGYDVYDYALWKGWLFLEESSAETIINRIIIPNFAKGLIGGLKTFSARGFDDISEKFKSFSEVFVYAHLSGIYKNRAWVVIDNGSKEKKEIDKLKKDYSAWDYESHFRQLGKHNFEEYYPEKFSVQVAEIIDLDHVVDVRLRKDLKKEKKKQLLLDVLAWYKDQPEEAVKAFAVSANEIITIMQSIEKVLTP